MTRLWLVRHGPTHAKGLVGWTDLPADLSDLGALDRLAAYLPNAPIVSSDLSRAITTADAIAKGRPRLPHDKGLREMHFGAWEMRTYSELEAADPGNMHAFWNDPTTVSPPEGESWDTAAMRVSTALERHLTAGLPDLIVVAHFCVILTLVQRAMRVSAAQVIGNKIDNLSATDLNWDGTDWSVGRINHRP